MKKIITLVIALSMVLSSFSVVSAGVIGSNVKTYGYDNLNNNSGDLIIGFLGGSITQGAGASNMTYDDNTTTSGKFSTQLVKRYFKTKFPNKNVIEYNAGVGGTPSDLGAFRMKTNLKLKSTGTPDVVFVEFAVNDAGTCGSADGKNAVASNMESIVRQLLDLPKQPVIIFVYTTCSTPALVANAMEAHQRVADYYGIGSIDLNTYIWDEVAKGNYVWNMNYPDTTLTVDNTHPNNKGYTVYADYIMKQFNSDYGKFFKKAIVRNLPRESYVYGDPDMYPASTTNAIYNGSWTIATDSVNSKDPTAPTGMSYYFPSKMMASSTVGNTITYTFKGRSLGLYCSQGYDSGNLDYVIDEGTANQKTGTVSMYRNGSYMAMAKIITKDLANAEHTVKFTISKNSSSASAGYTGTYCGIGYFMVDETMPYILPEIKNLVLPKQN